MQKSNRFPRLTLFLALLTTLLAGTSTPVFVNESASAAPLRASAPLDVIISEVAWGGTSSSYTADEWIELYNNTNSPIILSGWTLAADDGDPNISLTGTIPANGYYLLESSDDSTISNITADQIYSGTLSNSGEVLRLKEGSSTIDTANISGSSWDAGHNIGGSLSYSSMERKTNPFISPDAAAEWFSNNGMTGNGLAADGTTHVNGSPHNSQIDLSLTMTASAPPSPIVGSTIVFTITVTNNGNYDATKVTVKDVFPTAGLTLGSAIGTGSYTVGTGIWDIGTLTPSAPATLTMTATVTAAGVKTNRAEIWTVDQFDPDSTPGNSITEDDLAVAKIIVPVAPTLNITNAVNNSIPNVGTNVVFTITVINPITNPYTATNVGVAAAILPPGLIYVSHAITATPSIPSSTYNSASGIWTIGTLANGASATLIVTAKVISSVPSPNNYLTTVSSDEFIDSTATATINPVVGTDSDLSLTHDAFTVSTSAADQVKLNLRLHNAGPDMATNVKVKDLLPAGLNYVSYSSSFGTYSSGTGIWTVNPLASGADATITITVIVSSSGTSTNNFAEVWSSDQYDADSTPGNGSTTEDDDDSMEIPIADLNLTQTVDISGSIAVFTIKVSNAGPDDAANITVKNSTLASVLNYTYVSDGSTAGTTYDSVSGIWNVGTLLSGASATLTVTTTIVSTAVNWAEVWTVSEVDPDSVPRNCSPTGSPPASPCIEDDDASAPSPDLSITNSVLPVNPNVGGSVVFTIKVSNTGAAPATAVEVKDLLPAGLTYVSYTSTLGAYSNTSGITKGIWTVGTLGILPGNSNATLNITATVAANGIYTNAAEVWKSAESDIDSTPGNGSTIEDDYASATITSFRSVIINEVAWAGTAASPNDEWLELYNPSSADITLTGWKIRKNACDGSGLDYIALANGSKILKGGFFLLERGLFSTDNSTVSDVAADQIYLESTTPALLDGGEVLYLCDSLGNFIDTANKNGGAWPKGNLSPNYASMERVGISTETDTTWATNLGNPKNGKNANNGPIYGTPKRVNSVGAPAPTPVPTIAPAPVIILLGRPIINEFLARPGFDWNQDGKVNVDDEFIEIKNIGNADISISGWTLDDEANLGSNPFTLPAINLKVGERKVFYGLQTNILLSDGGDTVRLINPSGKIFDSYTYPIAKIEDHSFCRLVDGNGSWFDDCLPTPNFTNTREGVVPSLPGGGVFESPVCDLPDTLPADFLFAECRGFGANIWDSFYWDKFGWQGTQYIPGQMSKWESFVE